MRSQATTLSIIVFSFAFLLQQAGAFSRIAARDATGTLITRTRRPTAPLLLVLEPGKQNAKAPHQPWILSAKDDNNDENSIMERQSEEPVIVRGFEQGEISDEAWENVETGEPPKWIVMKEMLGINIFTYVLAALIVGFLTANFVLGPGWLGQALGMQGTGTFTDVSPSLPDTVDLNDPNFLL